MSLRTWVRRWLAPTPKETQADLVKAGQAALDSLDADLIVDRGDVIGGRYEFNLGPFVVTADWVGGQDFVAVRVWDADRSLVSSGEIPRQAFLDRGWCC